MALHDCPRATCIGCRIRISVEVQRAELRDSPHQLVHVLIITSIVMTLMDADIERSHAPAAHRSTMKTLALSGLLSNNKMTVCSEQRAPHLSADRGDGSNRANAGVMLKCRRVVSSATARKGLLSVVLNTLSVNCVSSVRCVRPCRHEELLSAMS